MNSIKRVYSLKSELIIKQTVFDLAVKDFKSKFIKNEFVQKADTLPQILKICGWSPRISYPEGHIKGLVYDLDEWIEHPEFNFANRALYILSHYVEPGGFIQMVNENSKHYWVYRFINFSLKKDKLTKIFIDFKNEQELIINFKNLSKALIKSGIKRDNLKDLIDDYLITELIK